MAAISEVPKESASDVASVMGPDGDLAAPRLARGCRCFAARLGHEVIAYGWLSTTSEWIGELDLEITPNQGEGYIWNCATRPDHRRKGHFRAIVNAISNQAQSDGLKRMWIGTVAVPAEKAIPELGFVPVLHFSSETLSGIRWLKVRSAPGVEPGLLAAGREVLAVGGRPLRLDTWMKRATPRRH